MNKKNVWITILLILAAGGVVVFCFWRRIELPEVEIGGIELSLLVAEEKKFFENEGLKTKLKILSSKNNVSGLLAGEIDYLAYGLSVKPITETSLRNGPIKTIILTSRFMSLSIIAQPELELDNLKTIGIYSRYTPQHYLALKLIRKNSLKTEIIAPESRETPWDTKKLQSLLSTRKVDAIFISSFDAHQLQSQGFSILETIIDELPLGFSVRSDKIEKNPEEVQKVVRALEKTMEFIINEPEEIKKLIFKAWDLKETEENTNLVNDYYSFLKKSYDRRDVPADEGAELLIKLAKAGEFETLQEVEEQVVTQEELDKVFDFRFVR